jgi:hypothetical protein
LGKKPHHISARLHERQGKAVVFRQCVDFGVFIPYLSLMWGVERKWGRQRKLGSFEGGNAVKWTVRIEVTQDGKGPPTSDIGTITRSTGDLLPEQIGLTLEEGRQLLHRIQMAIIGHQVHGYEIRRRLCKGCGRHQRIKDTRRKCVQTAFGAFRLRGRRYRVCRCQARGIGTVLFPLGEIIPRRTTPEVRFLFAELGATMPCLLLR